MDLIGVDRATSETVIVENQLAVSDHTHLGQLLTYAGGTDAVNIVWIATTLREEHRAALDWLNNRTDEQARFFGIEVSAVRIGESLPAPRLGVVVQPNDWRKRVKPAAQAATITDRMTAYAEFWTRLLEQVQEQSIRTGRGRGKVYRRDGMTSRSGSPV